MVNLFTSLSIFPRFIQPFLTRKTDTIILFETPSFSNNGNRRYKYLVIDHKETYFVNEHLDSKNKYSEDDIKMFELLVDNIFVCFFMEKSSSRQLVF